MQASGKWKQQQLHILLRRSCLVDIFPSSADSRICSPSPTTDAHLSPPTSPAAQNSCSPSTSSPPPPPRLLPCARPLALLPVASLPHLPQPHPLIPLQHPHHRCHHLLYHPHLFTFDPPPRSRHLCPPICCPPPRPSPPPSESQQNSCSQC